MQDPRLLREVGDLSPVLLNLKSPVLSRSQYISTTLLPSQIPTPNFMYTGD
jgi:hypothetical protein